MSDTLPVSVLLGTDVPELADLLGERTIQAASGTEASALVVMTWAQTRQQDEEEAIRREREISRYPEAVPLRSIDAEHVDEELIKLFSRVGIPREILTDQGSNFTSRLLTEIYKLLHVHPIRTTPYHRQTDGLVERFNKTLKSLLRKTASDGKDWDKLLPYLLFAYREVPQASTGFSPFELLYGRAVHGPLDVLKETWESDRRSTESVVSHVLSIREKMS